MRKIMVLGDTHGNSAWVNRVLKRAAYLGCDTVIQVGDFGYWEHFEDGRAFLKSVSKWSKKHGIEFYWIDGNHENFDMLFSGNYKAAAHAPFWKIRDNLFYIPRGTVWEWEGFTFAGIGGAVSVDRDSRTPGYSWWSQEQIRNDDVLALEDNLEDVEHVDFLFTHDCGFLPDTGRRFYKVDDISERHRNVLKYVVDISEPRHHFHGHYHYFHRTENRLQSGWNVDTIGLGCDGMPDCHAVLEVDDGEKRITFPWDLAQRVPDRYKNPRVEL